MELRDLEYFARIAALGNVRRAADELDMSPAALSKCLRRLEQGLNAKLTRRTPKGVELTAVGSALLAQVSRIRLTMQDVVREAEHLSLGQAGHLRIGTSPVRVEETYSAYARLLKDAPRATVDVSVSDNDVLIPMLQAGELDLIVNYLPEAPIQGCVQEAVYDDDIAVCVSPRHPLARQKSVTMAELTRERWVLTPMNMYPWHWLHAAFASRGLPAPQVAVETRSLRMRLLLVASSNLLSFTSTRVIQQAVAGLRLKALLLKEVTWRRPVGVIFREGGYLPPVAIRFIEILRAAAKSGSLDAR